MASRRQNLLLPFSFSFRYPYLIVIPMLDSCVRVAFGVLGMHAHFFSFCVIARSLYLHFCAKLFALFLFDLKWHARFSTCNFFLPSTVWNPDSRHCLVAAIAASITVKQPMAIRTAFRKNNDKFIKCCNIVYLWAISINSSFVDAVCYNLRCERERVCNFKCAARTFDNFSTWI